MSKTFKADTDRETTSNRQASNYDANRKMKARDKVIKRRVDRKTKNDELYAY